MEITLKRLLELVGTLDDSEGKDTPRERFRSYLRQDVTEIGQVRDFVTEALNNTGSQYARALQDIVNHIGVLLGFQCTSGRYQGTTNDIGFDGLWKSPTGFHIVVEVKTTEVYPIKTATLVHYVDELISEKKIENWSNALGLYVIGRPDPSIKQLENAISAENRNSQLRIASVESLLTLAEMKSEYDVTHDDILAILLPSNPTIDPIIQLMGRLVASSTSKPESELETEEGGSTEESEVSARTQSTEVTYWLSPVTSDDVETAAEVIENLVGREQFYAFGDRTPGHKALKPGDMLCFYETTKGVVAHAEVSSSPIRKPDKRVRHPDDYPWTFKLTKTKLYLNEPVVIDLPLRQRLDAFKGKDSKTPWAWFVQVTHKLTKHDFELLTKTAKLG